MDGSARPLAPGNAGDATPTFRLALVQMAAPLLVGALVGTAFAYVLVAATGSSMTAGELWAYVSAAILASMVVPALPPHYRVEIRGTGLVLHGNRRRNIAWRDITGLQVRKTAGVRMVVVHTVDGRRTTLRAPMSLLDPRFDDKAQALVACWTARRGDPDRE
ncbi:hypothetical protein [Streptomyces bobili]|uniref:hypothetical protein n=1 Tax=Streptomyces bobili TaxID=67280 RepID=UPI00371393EB